jgi:hypothetical protein
VLERRQQLRQQLNGKVILAPLTKGTCMRSHSITDCRCLLMSAITR